MSKFDVGQLATLACILEISAPKPGNVHRGAEFPDMSFEQMLCGAVAIGPVMTAAAQHRLGDTILAAVRATRNSAGVNTNLGTILLLAPLAATCASADWQTEVRRLLNSLDERDANEVYEAIRLANPGGMGSRSRYDIQSEPPTDLLDAMRLAASTDLIAAQYAHGFVELFRAVVPALTRNATQLSGIRQAIVHTHVELMAEFPDSLIARKCGREIAKKSAARAQSVLKIAPGSEDYIRALADFDFWLRADGNQRNPGTTADLIAAGLFVLLHEGTIPLPLEGASGWSFT